MFETSMISTARGQQTISPSKSKLSSPAIREATARLILHITSTFSNAEGTDLSFRALASLRNRFSSSLIISTQPCRLSHRASPDSGAFFCAVSTISHIASAVRYFGFENNKKGKIAREKASSTTSCETAGRKCKARKEICARRIAREV